MTFPTLSRSLLAAAALSILATAAQAQVTVNNAWVRATVPNQKSTGAFMELQAAQDSKLVAAQSPVAGVVEVHEMKMQDNVMKMRQVASIPLPAGKPVELGPGGYHVMMMQLRQQMKEGDSVPITLVIEDKDGKRQNVQVTATVKPLGAQAKPDMNHMKDMPGMGGMSGDMHKH